MAVKCFLLLTQLRFKVVGIIFVYALIGPSGTGKSHHAPLYAYENNISVIIDDGLLIENSQVVAGISAKRERTRFSAVKRALMVDPEHAGAIQNKLKEIKPEKILILGTSRRMAQRISDRLDLPHPHHYISIEELIPSETIDKALQTREKENRHVIPIPTFAIKKDFPGYLIAPLRSFFNRAATEHKEIALERSVVRPIYSSLGNFFINEHVVSDLTRHIGENFPGIYQVNQVNIYSDSRGVTMEIKLTLVYAPSIKDTMVKLQQEIKEKIEYYTGFYLNHVHLVAKRLYLPHQENKELYQETSDEMLEKEEKTLPLGESKTMEESKKDEGTKEASPQTSWVELKRIKQNL